MSFRYIVVIFIVYYLYFTKEKAKIQFFHIRFRILANCIYDFLGVLNFCIFAPIFEKLKI